MQDAATIIATRDGYAEVKDVITSLLPAARLQGEVSSWKTITAEVESGTIVFNSLSYTGPMDRFSRIWLPISSRFDQVRTKNKNAKERALNTLNQCLNQRKLLIGVTAAPAFEADPRFSQCLAAVAEAVGGLIFTGEALVEPSGRLILDFKGHSDL